MKDSKTPCCEEKRIYSMLSLARKAGSLKSGEFQTLEAVEKGRAKLVIIAEDASDNTGKRFMDKCGHRGIPRYVFGRKEELGRATGTGERSALALTDAGLAEAVTRLITAKGVTNG